MDFFGTSLTLEGQRALIGSDHLDFNSGAAYLFESDSSGVWQQVSRLTASDSANGDYFGVSVALDGDRALIGAYGVNDQGVDSGAADAFRRDPNGNWVETGKLLPSGAADGDEWGFGAVALAGDSALISGHRNETLGSGSGAAAPSKLAVACVHNGNPSPGRHRGVGGVDPALLRARAQASWQSQAAQVVGA